MHLVKINNNSYTTVGIQINEFYVEPARNPQNVRLIVRRKTYDYEKIECDGQIIGTSTAVTEQCRITTMQDKGEREREVPRCLIHMDAHGQVVSN